MNKELIKSYDILNLPFSSTVEEVEIRKNALIKVYNNKAVKKGVSYDKQIGEIETSASLIIENIKKNGIPNTEYHLYNSSWKSIIMLCGVLLAVALICWFSCYIFL